MTNCAFQKIISTAQTEIFLHLTVTLACPLKLQVNNDKSYFPEVIFAEKTLTVNATMQRIQLQDSESLQKTKVIITVPKSNYSARVIPLNEYLLALCQKFLSHNPQAYFLTGSETKFTKPRTLQYKFKKYCKDCQLDNVHFHTLRHTFPTRCVEAGFEIKSLSEILGHSTPKITLERYVHSSLELKRINMNKLNTVFF